MPQAPVASDLQRFLAKPRPAVVATIRPDGSPATAACWYEWTHRGLLLTMDADGRRIQNIRRDPRVALTVLGDSWYTQVSLLGRVIEIRNDLEFVDADRLSMRYLGQPYDRRDHPGVTVIIEVERWHTWGDPGAEVAAR